MKRKDLLYMALSWVIMLLLAMAVAALLMSADAKEQELRQEQAQQWAALTQTGDGLRVEVRP